MKKHLYYLIIFAFILMTNFGKSQPTFFFPETTYADQNDVVCIPITVLDFTDIIDVEIAFGWDETVLEFQDVLSINNNLSVLQLVGFTLPSNSDGKLRMNWESGDCPTPPQSATLPDGEILLELCFTVIGEMGDSSPIEFIEWTPPNFVTRLNANCNDIGFLPMNGEVVICDSSPVLVYGNEVFGNVGETVSVEFRLDNFIDIASLQLSVGWNENDIQIISIEPSGLPIWNVGQQISVASDFLAGSWFNPDGVTLPDSTVFLTLNFEILSSFNETLIEILDTPIDIEFLNPDVLEVCVETEPAKISPPCLLIPDPPVINGYPNSDFYSQIFLTATTQENTDIFHWTTSCGNITNTGGCNEQATITFPIFSNCNNSGLYQICVQAENECGLSEETCIYGYIYDIPPYPIMGDSVVCENSISTYQVWNGGTWSVTGGTIIEETTTQITVEWGGTTGTGIIYHSSAFEWDPINITIVDSPPSAPNFIESETEICGSVYGFHYVVEQQSDAASYEWTLPTGAFFIENTDYNDPSDQDNSAVILNFVNSPGGQLCVKALNGCGESPQTCININQNSFINPSSVITNTPCNTEMGGMIDLTVIGDNSPFTFQWSNGETSEDITNLGIGNYTVTITDAVGCKATLKSYVSADVSIGTYGTVTNESVPGLMDGSIDFYGDTLQTYLWNTGDTTQDLSNLAEGEYFLTITDTQSGCTTETSFEVEGCLVLNISETNAGLAQSGIVDIEVENFTEVTVMNFALEWDTTNVESVNLINLNPILPNLDITDFILTDSSLILFWTSAMIDEQTLPDNTVLFQLEFVRDSPLNSTNNIIINPNHPDLTFSHPFLGFDNPVIIEYCHSFDEGNITFSANPCPLIQSITPDTALCDPSELQLFVDAPNAVSYEWSPAFNLNDPTIPNPIAFPTFNESISVVVTDVNGCTDFATVNIEVPFGLDWGLQEWSNAPVCEGDTLEMFSILPNGVVAWEWTGPGSFNSNLENPKIVGVDEGNEGLYNVTLTDDNGCTGTADFYVDVLETPIPVNFPAIQGCPGEPIEFCFPNTNGEYYIFDLPFVMPFTDNCFTIPDGSSAYNGEYCVTLIDGNGCASEQTCIDIVLPETPIFDAGPDLELNCVNIEVTLMAAISPTANYAFEWTTSNGCIVTNSNILNPIVNCPGVYELTVIDLNSGCTFSDEMTVFANTDVPIIDLDIPTDVCLGSSIEICSPFSAPDYTNEWDLGNGSIVTDCLSISDFQNSDIGTYCLIVTDNINACENQLCFDLDITGDCVWPGDTDTSKTVNNFDLLNIGLAYDSVGPIRPNATLNWEGQFAESWTQTTPNTQVNFKHIDTDGSGLINADDTLAITQNWGQMHNLWAVDDRDMGTPFYVEPDTFTANSTYALPIILGDPSFQAMDVYGVAFTIEIDTNILCSNASVSFDNSWLGSINNDMVAIQKTFLEPMGGQVDIAVTRIDGQNITGNGQFGTFYITIEDIIFQAPPGGGFDLEKELFFEITNVRAITFQEIEIDVDTNVKPSLATSDYQEYLEQFIKVFPNPASDILHIQSGEIKLEKIEFVNLAGQQILSENADVNTFSIVTTEMLPGTYFIKIYTREGVLVKRVVIF